jgi:hypothetical protein
VTSGGAQYASSAGISLPVSAQRTVPSVVLDCFAGTMFSGSDMKYLLLVAQDHVKISHSGQKALNGCHRWEREGTWFPHTPILVGCVGFSTSSKNQHTPLQSRGTRQRAFFAVRKQHTKQVTPVEDKKPGSAGGSPALGRAASPHSQKLVGL